MGERWKQNRAKSFTQQQCLAYERQLKTCTLFSRTTAALLRTFSCTGNTSVSELRGATVLLRPRGDDVVVIYGNIEIGFVIGTEANEVAHAIASEAHCPGMALAAIEDAASVTGEFAVRIIDHSEVE